LRRIAGGTREDIDGFRHSLPAVHRDHRLVAAQPLVGAARRAGGAPRAEALYVFEARSTAKPPASPPTAASDFTPTLPGKIDRRSWRRQRLPASEVRSSAASVLAGAPGEVDLEARLELDAGAGARRRGDDRTTCENM
jgi:hypothetical protein